MRVCIKPLAPYMISDKTSGRLLENLKYLLGRHKSADTFEGSDFKICCRFPGFVYPFRGCWFETVTLTTSQILTIIEVLLASVISVVGFAYRWGTNRLDGVHWLRPLHLE